MEIESPYRPRKYQKEFETAMFDGIDRAFLLWHRRCGKDLACFNFMINEAVKAGLKNKPGTYFYILPTYAQGKRVIWNGIDESGKKFLNYIHPRLYESRPNNTEMLIRLVGGSIIQIVGSEQYDNLRGTNPMGVVLSEYAMQDPRVWEEVLSPILRKNKGWAVFNTTPMGKNHAYDLWNMAIHQDHWFTQKLTIKDTSLISRQEIEQELSEGKSEEVILQEYYCEFSRGIDGTYYGRLMSKVWDDGRITSVPHDPVLPVYTSFDLGIGDSTAIWFFQITPGGEIHFIDFYENFGESISHYVDVLNTKNYTYKAHYFPHDVKARELGSGMTRQEMLQNMGVNPTIVPKLKIEDGIQAVRSVLPRAWFDKTKCQHGIKHLENYKKHFSDKLRTFVDRPMHDEHSHASDSFRYASLAITNDGHDEMTQEKADELYFAYSPYK